MSADSGHSQDAGGGSDRFDRALGRSLDRRGASHRDALSAEALARISAMSDLQLPLAGSAEPPVLARIEVETSRRYSSWAWRVAAAVAVVAGIGTAAVLIARGLGGDAPKSGSLADGASDRSADRSPGWPSAEAVTPPESAVVQAARSRLRPEHIESALSGVTGSASAVVVALSGAADEPSVHYPDLDESLAADIAPFFHSGSLLDGGGTTYQDLSGEFAAIVAKGSFH